MNKTVKSPIKRFPGEVTFYDPLTFPQSIAFSKNLLAAIELPMSDHEEIYEYVKLMIPAIKDCIEKYDIEEGGDLKPENFPSTPNADSQALLAWLVGEIVKIYKGTEPEDPKK